MFRRKFLMAAVVAGIAALAGPATSQAAFEIKITSGAFDHTFTDGDNNGIINDSISLNGYSIEVNASFAQNSLAGLLQNTAITVTTTRTTAANIVIESFYDGFTFAPVGATVNAISSISTTNLPSGTSGTVVSSIDGTVAPPLVLNGPTFNGSAVVNFDALIGNNPFEMGNTMTIAGLTKDTGFGQLNLTATTFATAVPAPAGLILAATALPFVGLLRRRLRRPEATTAA